MIFERGQNPLITSYQIGQCFVFVKVQYGHQRLEVIIEARPRDKHCKPFKALVHPVITGGLIAKNMSHRSKARGINDHFSVLHSSHVICFLFFQQDVQKHSVHTLVFRSLKRTHDMFISDQANPPPSDSKGEVVFFSYCSSYMHLHIYIVDVEVSVYGVLYIS